MENNYENEIPKDFSPSKIEKSNSDNYDNEIPKDFTPSKIEKSNSDNYDNEIPKDFTPSKIEKSNSDNYDNEIPKDLSPSKSYNPIENSPYKSESEMMIDQYENINKSYMVDEQDKCKQCKSKHDKNINKFNVTFNDSVEESNMNFNSIEEEESYQMKTKGYMNRIKELMSARIFNDADEINKRIEIVNTIYKKNLVKEYKLKLAEDQRLKGDKVNYNSTIQSLINEDDIDENDAVIIERRMAEIDIQKNKKKTISNETVERLQNPYKFKKDKRMDNKFSQNSQKQLRHQEQIEHANKQNIKLIKESEVKDRVLLNYYKKSQKNESNFKKLQLKTQQHFLRRELELEKIKSNGSKWIEFRQRNQFKAYHESINEDIKSMLTEFHEVKATLEQDIAKTPYQNESHYLIEKERKDQYNQLIETYGENMASRIYKARKWEKMSQTDLNQEDQIKADSLLADKVKLKMKEESKKKLHEKDWKVAFKSQPKFKSDERNYDKKHDFDNPENDGEYNYHKNTRKCMRISEYAEMTDEELRKEKERMIKKLTKSNI